MNERLTIQDLTDLLAAKHGMTKKDAEAFVKEFFLLIEQALESDKTVKIKGLGTFKLINVDSRESVNVNTGERFQIKGHTKVSFSADTNLRDTINKPFAHFETVVLNENTILEDTPIEDTEEEETGEDIIAQEVSENEKIDIQEDSSDIVLETVAAIETDGSVPEADSVVENDIVIIEQSIEPVIEETASVEVVSEEKVIKQDESGEQPVTEAGNEETSKGVSTVEQEQPDQSIKEEKITAEKIIEQELLKANLKPEIPIVPLEPEAKTTEPSNVTKPVTQKDTPKKEKSPVPYLIAIIIIVLLLCGGVILFIYYPDLFSSSSDKNALEMPLVTTQPVQPETQLSDTIEHKDSVEKIIPGTPKTVAEPQPITKKEEVTPSVKPVVTENKTTQQQPSSSVYLDSASYKITGTKTKYTIKEGETLTRVSLRFYGTKAMWPYIVKHNPDVIKNPNHVPYGTTLKIPELVKE